jgi:hypothetical protein
VFRLLPVNPGPDISTAANAVLADLSGWCLEGFLCRCPVSGSSDQGPQPAVCQGLAGGAMSSFLVCPGSSLTKRNDVPFASPAQPPVNNDFADALARSPAELNAEPPRE